jgi:Ubiquitin carboxyl-terminal hydrolase
MSVSLKIENYLQFNALCLEALQVKDPTHLKQFLEKLKRLKNEILSDKEGLRILDKEHTYEWVRADLSKKTSLIFKKCFSNQGKIKNCVGLPNISNNCWATAMLQMCMQIPHLKKALETVGGFFQSGNSFDQMDMEETLKAVKDGNLEKAVESYQHIVEPIFRLKTIQTLQKTEVSPEILSRFIFPSEYKDRLLMLIQSAARDIQNPTSKDLLPFIPIAIDHMIDNAQTGFAAKQEQLKKNGEDLLEIIEAYQTAVEEGHPITISTVQHVREAFHHLFQTRLSNGTICSIVSKESWKSEDSHEAIQGLITCSEKIQKIKKEMLPTAYFFFETIRCFIPDEETPATDVPLNKDIGDYSRLALGRNSSVVTADHQILLMLPQDNSPISLENLLLKNCRMAGNGFGNFLTDDNRIQRHLCIEERQVIHGAPQQLTIVLKRFYRNGNQSIKNNLNVQIPRIMVLPADMTTASGPIAYVLQAFVVHSGAFGNGHYLAYRNEGDWTECNDRNLRLMTEMRIDEMLHGPYYSATPYFLYYKKADDQPAALFAVSDLKKKISTGMDLSPFERGELVRLLAVWNTLVQADPLKTDEVEAALDELEDTFPVYFNQMRSLIDLGKTGLDPAKKDLIQQLLVCEKFKRDIQEIEHAAQQLDHLLTILYSSDEDADFVKFFDALPPGLYTKFREALLLTEEEGNAFEGACKYGNLQTFIQDKLKENHRINLHGIVASLHEERHNLEMNMHRENLTTLLHLIKANASRDRLLDLFNFFQFPSNVKEQLFYKICKTEGRSARRHIGERLFKKNPKLLAKNAVLAAGQTATGDQATIAGQVILSLK